MLFLLRMHAGLVFHDGGGDRCSGMAMLLPGGI